MSRFLPLLVPLLAALAYSEEKTDPEKVKTTLVLKFDFTADKKQLNRAIDELTMRDGRSPTPDEVAAHTGLGSDLVLEALRARVASTAVGLDEPGVEHPSTPDPALQEVEQRLDLGARLDRLDARSRRAVVLRFGLELSQREIAERLGISQMHVSRLLRAAMVTLADDREDGNAATG